ncbi:MAG: AAA family ATPase [Clostridium sp.]|nr:AAA family ATPase [Clostridium sp.]
MGKTVAICNQKGGVGKTTTTISLGVALARQGKRVLLVDADPQADLTNSLGWYNSDDMAVTLSSILEGLIHDKELDVREAILHHAEGVDIIPANIELSSVETQLVTTMSRERSLKHILDSVNDDYDYTLIDCMPSLGMITINALTAADSLIIPVQAQYLPAKGMTQLLQTVSKVKRYLNPNLDIEGVLITLKDGRTNLAKETSNMLRSNFGQMLNVFETEIPVATKAAETSAHAKSIFEYDPAGTVAAAYDKLGKEVMNNGERLGLSSAVGTERPVFDTGTERQ